jgi:predicted RNA methylase
MLDRKAWRDRVTSFLSLITLGFDLVGLESGEVDVSVCVCVCVCVLRDFWGQSVADAGAGGGWLKNKAAV